MTEPEPADILVKLYDLPPPDPERLAGSDVTIRIGMPLEKHFVTGWVGRHFEPTWVSEVDVAYAKRPISCLLAVRAGELLGFACYDATARGLFGPTGVDPDARGLGIGSALYLATLAAMRDQGYAYAVVGAAGPIDFYVGLAGGIVIPDSWPGLYRGRLTEGVD